MEKEKVIFRREYDPYRKEWTFLAVFPEEEANGGRICAVPFYIDGHGTTWYEAFCEISFSYYYSKTRIIHKKDAVIPKLLSAIERRYGQAFRVVEKIIH